MRAELGMLGRKLGKLHTQLEFRQTLTGFFTLLCNARREKNFKCDLSDLYVIVG